MLQHSMIYFFHHYELPAILQQARIQQILVQTQHQQQHQQRQQMQQQGQLAQNDGQPVQEGQGGAPQNDEASVVGPAPGNDPSVNQSSSAAIPTLGTEPNELGLMPSNSVTVPNEPPISATLASNPSLFSSDSAGTGTAPNPFSTQTPIPSTSHYNHIGQSTLEPHPQTLGHSDSSSPSEDNMMQIAETSQYQDIMPSNGGGDNVPVNKTSSALKVQPHGACFDTQSDRNNGTLSHHTQASLNGALEGAIGPQGGQDRDSSDMVLRCRSSNQTKNNSDDHSTSLGNNPDQDT